MSYLDGPRLTFRGRFLGDVPTQNNSTAAFTPGTTPDPGWNPTGGGSFDLLDCAVVGGERAPGSPIRPGDPETALAVRGAADRVAAKLVDLDPDWQNSSEIWGLVVRLVDPDTGETLLRGAFRPAPFRDAWPRQVGGVAQNRMPVGAAYVSVLEDVVFGPTDRYPALDALRAATTDARLSIVLDFFGFYYAHVDGLFATGGLTGAIGPWRPGEPRRFVAGRRLDAGALPEFPATPTRPASGPIRVGRAMASVDTANARLVVDLGNAYPLANAAGTPLRLSPTVTALEVGVLADESVGVGDDLAADEVIVVGEVALATLVDQAGIVAFPLTPEALEAVADRPIALLAARAGGRRLVVSRESADGLYLRVDDMVHRLDAGEATTATWHAVRRGRPAAGVTVHLAAAGGADSVLSLPPSAETLADGTVTVDLVATDPRNPRGAVDGAVETVTYAPRLARDGTPDYTGTGLDPGADVLVAHVRDAWSVPATPVWSRDVAPILAPYAALYPIMGQHLLDLGDEASVRRWRAAILFALDRDIADPNHMPVTRDLSGPKRATILRWLEQLEPSPTRRASPVDAGPTSSVPVHDAKSDLAAAAADRAGPHPRPDVQ